MRFEYRPNEVTTSIEVLPENTYKLTFREPKAYMRSTDKGTYAGLRFVLTTSDGKLVTRECNFASDFGLKQAKQMHMAAFGFTPGNAESEKKYNAFCEEKGFDFKLDTTPEATYIGQGWLDVKGKTVDAHLGITTNDAGTQFQQWKSVGPIE